MAADPRRQWHVSELLDALTANGDDIPEAVDKYVLNILLSRSTQFQNMGRMVWSLKASHSVDARGRIDLRDACVHVLQEAGRPLHSREIKERIGRLRGTSEFFFIQPSDKIARVGPNYWGLIERDFFLDEQERSQFLADLYTVLERRQIGLHVSELLSVNSVDSQYRSDVSGYMLMGLAQTDPRFRVHRGHLLALAVWNDARRLNVNEAVNVSVRGQMEVFVPQLLETVATAIGREAQRGEITNTLLQLGWRRVNGTEIYVMSAGDDEELSEEESIDGDLMSD
jgi:hypothetical protein